MRKYNNKGSPRFIRELLTDFSSPPPAVDGPRQQSLTNGIFFCLFFYFIFLLVSPVTTTTFPFDGGGGCVQTFVFSLKASRGSVFVRETEAIVCHVVHGSSSYL
jgi:hypothetical protein